MSGLARATDAVLEASVVGSFSRIGFAVRSRLLPEFTSGPRLDEAGQAGGGGPHGRHVARGRVALVTGATSGLGLAAASELARRGWAVHFMARDPGRAARAQRQISATGAVGGMTGPSGVSYGIADMEDEDSVRAFAGEFRGQHRRLDVLVHAAGAIHPRFGVNHAGIERTFAGQVIAPFLLTKLLLPALLAAAPGRVVTVSSGGMYAQRLEASTVEMAPSGYHGVTAYARAKRAQVALSREWARRTDPAGAAFHAMHPGWADTPGIAAALPRFHGLARPILRSPAEGADTIVWLATAPPGQLGSGRFWHDRRPRPENLLPWTGEHDPGTAPRLWDTIDATARYLSGQAGSDMSRIGAVVGLLVPPAGSMVTPILSPSIRPEASTGAVRPALGAGSSAARRILGGPISHSS
jgi:dehydrogenase/reductase SDR family member 12